MSSTAQPVQVDVMVIAELVELHLDLARDKVAGDPYQMDPLSEEDIEFINDKLDRVITMVHELCVSVKKSQGGRAI